MRGSSQHWQDHQAKVFTDCGLDRYAGDCCLYRWKANEEHGEVWFENHGDDTFAIGDQSDLEKLRDDVILNMFTCNANPIVGLAPGLAKEGKFLKKTFRVTQDGWQYEAD